MPRYRDVVRPEGLEPPAYRFEACRSIQLSYGRVQGQSSVADRPNTGNLASPSRAHRHPATSRSPRHGRSRSATGKITPIATNAPAPSPDAFASPADCAAEAERLLKRGAPLQAYDALAEGLRAFPDAIRLRQLTALSLARAGASHDANTLLHELLAEGHGDEETLGLLGRTYKDLWASSVDAAERQQHLDMAARVYADAYRATAGYWTGVNAATLALLDGRRDAAIDLARTVTAQCQALLDADPARGDRYWVLATLGETALVQADIAQAERWYRDAANAAGERIGDVVSTRRNARLLLEHLDHDLSGIDRWLPVPKVIVFAGHLIDRPERPLPRFRPDVEPAVRDAIRARVATIGPAVGYASAACGADILFLECLADAGMRTQVVLPYDVRQFREDSVDIVPGADWGERCERALARASEVVVASENRIGADGTSHEYGFRVLDGTAAVRADELDTELVCMAVWDGHAGDGPGGTASSVEHWQRTGRRTEIIYLTPSGVSAGTGAVAVMGSTPTPAHEQPASPALTTRHVTPAFPESSVPPSGPPQHEAGFFRPEIVSLLFADAHGFSRLTETELPIFVDQYLGLVARELADLGAAPILTNTWGDGLYAVFREVDVAGRFALALCDAVRRTDWCALGLRHPLGVRIGLHAGPAYACVDPVTARPNYIGEHVSRAARIEPVTPPGEVYASNAFAALARSAQVGAFSCTYVGQTPLAKNYGTFPTYVVRPRWGG